MPPTMKSGFYCSIVIDALGVYRVTLKRKKQRLRIDFTSSLPKWKHFRDIGLVKRFRHCFNIITEEDLLINDCSKLKAWSHWLGVGRSMKTHILRQRYVYYALSKSKVRLVRQGYAKGPPKVHHSAQTPSYYTKKVGSGHKGVILLA